MAMERLRQFPADCPVVVHSYEAGYDPVTDVESRSVTRTPHREWYVGVYDGVAAGRTERARKGCVGSADERG